MAFPMVPYTPYAANIRNRRPLVKRREERDYGPLIIDSRRSGPIQVSDRQLQKHMPSARNILRKNGNRRLTMQACFRGPFDSREDEDASQQVYEWLTSRLINPRYPNRTIPTMSGPITEDLFEWLYQDMCDAARINDMYEIEELSIQALRFFRALSEHLGRKAALNPMLFAEVMDKAMLFTSILQDNPPFMFDLLRSMFRMTRSEAVIQRLLETMTPDGHDDLFDEVQQMPEDSELIDEILSFLSGFSRMNRSAMIRHLSNPW